MLIFWQAITLEELYGDFDLATNEWTDGVLSSVMRSTCLDESKATGHMDKWILFDGPVDTVWIESMNSVMDDNKILTLINGERINMPENVILLFETQDLSQVRGKMKAKAATKICWKATYTPW